MEAFVSSVTPVRASYSACDMLPVARWCEACRIGIVVDLAPRHLLVFYLVVTVRLDRVRAGRHCLRVV